MQVHTTRFGRIEVDDTRLLNFPRGILGFPDLPRFALIQTNEEGNFFWLQSVDCPEVAFVVCDPVLFIPDYQVRLRPEDTEDLLLENPSDVQILVIVNKIGASLTGNLQGPLVLNSRNLLGRQLVLSERKYSTRHPLMDLAAQELQVSRTA
jgi:flagellar assembly factor FliW